jgi:uncharacterized membrane protein
VALSDDRVDRAENYAADVAGSGGADAEYVVDGRHVPLRRAWVWIADGWHAFRREPGIWVLLAIIFAALIFGINRIPVVGWFASTLVVPVFVGGFMTGCHALHRGGELELAHLFWGFRRNPAQLMALGLIALGLMLAVLLPAMLLIAASGFLGEMAGDPEHPATVGLSAILAFAAMLALFVPVNMALWFAPALVALQGHSAPRAVAQSFRGCWKNLAPFLAYLMTLFVLAMLASIPLGLGWLVLGPVGLASVYAAYRDIFLKR